MSNPVLTSKRWQESVIDASPNNVMTVNGAVNKTLFLLMVMALPIAYMWHIAFDANGAITDPGALTPFIAGGAIAGLVLVVVAMFTGAGPIISTLYAAAQGVFLGGVTALVHNRFPGLPLTAGLYTVTTLFGMLFFYRAGIIKATPGFIKGVVGATVGLILGYGVLFLLGLFGVGGGVVAAIHGNGAIGIGFSIFCVGLAALNLVIDFHVIEEGSRHSAPKKMEWQAAFGLLVTLVWLYIEILRLLSKLRQD